PATGIVHMVETNFQSTSKLKQPSFPRINLTYPPLILQ
ncbi:unnamed protein product, partial [Rotaria sordida]